MLAHREAGILPFPKTDVSFMPLIDQSSAHADTIKTSMEKGLSLVRGVGESILVFTADRQLFKIVVDVMLNEPQYFYCILAILGGMHMMMNFIHGIGWH